MEITKTMMSKALRDGTDQYEALRELRNMPRQDTGINPAEMMFGKNNRSLLPSTGTKSIPKKTFFAARYGLLLSMFSLSTYSVNPIIVSWLSGLI